MRVWDIHPGYLSRQNLLGQHVEIHAIYSVITCAKEGYARHPETMRWRHNLERLSQVHSVTVAEMKLRGYGHRSPLAEVDCPDEGSFCWVDPPELQFGLLHTKYAPTDRVGRIPLPKRGSHFWAHHKYAVMSRGYDYYKEIQAYMGNKADGLIEEEGALVSRVLEIIHSPMEQRALRNTVDHLWGYFKEIATVAEKEVYLAERETEPALLLPYFYQLACAYKIKYLLHSTIFADIN